MAEDSTASIQNNNARRLDITASRWALLILACVPWIFLVTFLLYARYVRQGIGPWPTPMSETVTLPYAPLFENICVPTHLLTWFSILLVSAMLIFQPELKGRKVALQVLFYVAGLATNWLFYKWNIGHMYTFFDWWID